MYLLNLEAEAATRAVAYPSDSYSRMTDISMLVTDVVYGTPASFDVDPLALDAFDYDNQTGAQNTVNWNHQDQIVATLTLQMQRSVKVGASVRISFPIYKDLKAEFGGSYETQTQETEATTHTHTECWSWSVSVTVPAHTHVAGHMFLRRRQTDVPFRCRAHTSGRVWITRMVVTLLPTSPGQLPNPTRLPMPVSFALGDLFRSAPHPDVSVIDSMTVECPIEGRFSAIVGTKLESVIHTAVPAATDGYA
jgi:Clostridium epsilon toxin ETX/Bacillus mosquitocidal toxin MTX2